MICKQCKKNIPNTEKICPYCGTIQVILRDKNGNIIPADQYPKQPGKNGQGNVDNYDDDDDDDDYVVRHGRKRKINPIVPVAVVGVVALAAVGGSKFVGNKETSPTEVTTLAAAESTEEIEETTTEAKETESQSETETEESTESEEVMTTAALELEDAVNWLATETTGYPDYILPDSNSRYISDEELMYFSAQELRLARNEIFARRGRAFEDVELATYFSNKKWYKATQSAKSFDYDSLNEYEKANVLLLQEMEPSAPTLVWKQKGQEWYGYDQDGNPIQGWIQNKGLYYYLEDDGRMVTGFLQYGDDPVQRGPLVTGEGYFMLADGSLFYGTITPIDSVGEIHMSLDGGIIVTQSELKFMGLEDYVGCSMINFNENGTFEVWGME